MPDYAFLITKIVHVLSAMAWLGGGLLMQFVLMPLLAQATPGTRREFGGRLYPAVTRFFNLSGGLAFLSGLVLVTLHPIGWSDLPFGIWGRPIAFGLITTIMALYLVNVAVRPTVRAIEKVMAGLGPNQEPPANLRFLQARLRFASILTGLLLVLTLIVMVYANATWAGP